MRFPKAQRHEKARRRRKHLILHKKEKKNVRNKEVFLIKPRRVFFYFVSFLLFDCVASLFNRVFIFRTCTISLLLDFFLIILKHFHKQTLKTALRWNTHEGAFTCHALIRSFEIKFFLEFQLISWNLTN